MGIEKFILSSTSSAYGNQPKQPFTEDMSTDRPVSPYAASKKAAEILTYTYHDRYGIDATVFRYFTVFGPAGRPDMSLFRFIRWIDTGEPVRVFGDGTQKRDFTFVDDVARGTIAGLSKVGYEIINIGNNKPTALLDVIGMIEQKLDKKANLSFEPPNPLDVPSTWADISKANRLLDWHPQVSLEEGIKKTVEWHQANRDWLGDIQL